MLHCCSLAFLLHRNVTFFWSIYFLASRTWWLLCDILRTFLILRHPVLWRSKNNVLLSCLQVLPCTPLWWVPSRTEGIGLHLFTLFLHLHGWNLFLVYGPVLLRVPLWFLNKKNKTQTVLGAWQGTTNENAFNFSGVLFLCHINALRQHEKNHSQRNKLSDFLSSASGNWLHYNWRSKLR